MKRLLFICTALLTVPCACAMDRATAVERPVLVAAWRVVMSGEDFLSQLRALDHFAQQLIVAYNTKDRAALEDMRVLASKSINGDKTHQEVLEAAAILFGIVFDANSAYQDAHCAKMPEAEDAPLDISCFVPLWGSEDNYYDFYGQLIDLNEHAEQILTQEKEANMQRIAELKPVIKRVIAEQPVPEQKKLRVRFGNIFMISDLDYQVDELTRLLRELGGEAE